MIHRLENMEQSTFCTKDINFLTGIDMQPLNYFELSIILLYVEPLCNIILKLEMQRSEFQGYIVMYLTEN